MPDERAEQMKARRPVLVTLSSRFGCVSRIHIRLYYFDSVFRAVGSENRFAGFVIFS